MRLLDTTTMEMKEFKGGVPPYAILSHVWGKDEVLFEDMIDPDPTVERMYGFKKIEYACKTAKQHHLRYIWIDTCCINKQSSTELSEAINSMYSWYKNAHVCYVYLDDTQRQGSPNNPGSFFATSRWFTRGWTLQELIAPSNVIFYAADWVEIGTKSSLREIISTTTGIMTEVILGRKSLDEVSVAARMSWAAGRKTDRVEDRAYSLMGLFEVNMPPLYGEGERAFLRLQHEIIKKSVDHSIFAWTMPGAADNYYRGILAHCPNEFSDSHKVEMGNRRIRKPYCIENQGLQIELPVVEITENGIHKTLAALDCHLAGKNEAIVITLVRADSFLRSADYVRSETASLEQRTVDISHARGCLLYIADKYPVDRDRGEGALIHGRLEVKVSQGYGKIVTSTHFERTSKNEWVVDISSPKQGTIKFEAPHKKEQFTVIIGIRESGGAWCNIQVLSDPQAGSTSELPREEPAGDRASENLVDGWMVAASVASLPSPAQPRVREPRSFRQRFDQNTPFTHHIIVQVRKSSRSIPIHPTPIQKQPNGHVGCLITPPAPGYGFTIGTMIYRQGTSSAMWVQHENSFIFYRGYGSDALGMMVLTSEDPNIKQLYLFVKPQEEYVWSAIWKDPWNIERVLRTNQPYIKTNPHYQSMDRRKKIYANVSHNRRTDLADHTIILSVR